MKLKISRNKVINMGEEISEELEAKARDEAIKRMLKAWEEKPEEKRASWGPIFGHAGASRYFSNSRRVRVSVKGGSTMAVTAHVKGSAGHFDGVVQLSPGETKGFEVGNPQTVMVEITGLGSGDQYAFGYWS